MLKKKYYIFIFSTVILFPVLALWDLTRQNNMAETFASKQIKQIVSRESSLKAFGLPTSLLGRDLNRVDTNYTLTQWEVIFSFEEIGFVQVYVKPKFFFIIPILNFDDDFEIDYISYTKYEQNE
jgi:hypothetical protein